ncbi:MAG: protein translocase subunit SecD [Parachlamydiaceae bacterium]
MEKQKRWQFYLILTVILLTLYNILPTVFYYTKPLKAPIDESRATKVAKQIVDRVDVLEQDAIDWLYSFNKLLHLKPEKIELQKDNAGLIRVSYKSKEEADRLKKFLPRAGLLIPFAPSQLELYPQNTDTNVVYVSRQVPIHLDKKEVNTLFRYIPKYENEKISQGYKDMVYDSTQELALSFGGSNPLAQRIHSILSQENKTANDDALINLAKELVDLEKTFSKNPEILKRFYAGVGQVQSAERKEFSIQKLIAQLETAQDRANIAKEKLESERKKLNEQKISLDPSQEQVLTMLEGNSKSLASAISLLKKNDFKVAASPLNDKEFQALWKASEEHLKPGESQQTINLNNSNPIVEALIVDWNSDQIILKLFDDIEKLRHTEVTSEASAYQKEKINQYVINEIARAARLADEKIVPHDDTFAVLLSQLPDSQSFLALDLGQVATKQSQVIKEQIAESFTPAYPDFKQEVYPVRFYSDWKNESPQDKRLGFVIYAPSIYQETALQGFRKGSIYVIAKGLDAIADKARANPQSLENKALQNDLDQLKALFQNMNFIGYSAADYDVAPQFANDYIFELNDYYSSLLKATRENFEVKGSKKMAILPFTNVEQRIITLNKIEDQEQEDLLRWAEEYQAAQVDIDPSAKYQVPAPTKSPFFNNFLISFKKYFRGDDRKIIKWGLDLSGGKTVRIGLRDHNNQPVTNPDDLKQSVNELYTRINKMGVSERTIRIENNHIVLEFPGSQALSAQDLVKASAMYFHVVNEKFNAGNSILKTSIQQFLQDIWNEAVVTNRKDTESINEIAWHHLGGESLNDENPQPLSEHARILYENGLRIANPHEKNASNAFNDSLSKIAMMRGNDFTEWDGQTNPLMVVFNNYALEGSSLTNVTVGYDPTEGNHLSFSVKKSYEGSGDRSSQSPRDDFYTWTSQFSEDKIAGTPKEAYTQGRGWRMAVILNDQIISKPALRAALRDSATISGRFTQREVSQLAADLKAGSLSFTPRILSEQNVSSELGSEEKTQGIMASIIGLVLVVAAMIGYYRFAGLVASCAVLFNIFIMWGVLQNLDAALTLPAIAGIVLTIGMAVDANVLVFERIREEFAVSGRIASAIQAGYKKAFSAIVDSNITTIIAALILIQFDSGPIKGFAITLIVGIVSSMFTALFMTRFFFAGWVQNPKHKSLSMAQFIGKTHIDFLKYAKPAITGSIIVMLIGSYLLFNERRTIFGMDFTGGYALTVEVEGNPSDTSYRSSALNALLAHGASARDVNIRELTRPNQLKIQLGIGMEEKGQPFYQMPEKVDNEKLTYSYQNNPRLVWIVKTLEDANLKLSDSQLASLDSNWTVMSGQFSDAMRNNALMALSLALISILIYITFRFEFKYALAAVIGLAHDVLITLGILAAFHALGFAVQIDLQVIGAIMTIIGYSLNDTIIVFDRIREDIRILRKMSFYEVINHALNVTLSRTVMTSGSTLLVLLALVLFGGQSIFAFSLVMTIGVLVGTFSSLFIATPALLYLHHREEAENQRHLVAKKG